MSFLLGRNKSAASGTTTAHHQHNRSISRSPSVLNISNISTHAPHVDYASILDPESSQPSSPLPSNDYGSNLPSPARLSIDAGNNTEFIIEDDMVNHSIILPHNKARTILRSQSKLDSEYSTPVKPKHELMLMSSPTTSTMPSTPSPVNQTISEGSYAPRLQPHVLQASFLLAHVRSWLLSSEEIEVRARLNETASDKHALKVRLHQTLQRFTVNEKKLSHQLAILSINEERVRQDLDRIMRRMERAVNQTIKKRSNSSASAPVSPRRGSITATPTRLDRTINPSMMTPMRTPKKERMSDTGTCTPSTVEQSINQSLNVFASTTLLNSLKEQKQQLWSNLESIMHTRNAQRQELATINQSINLLTQALYQTNVSSRYTQLQPSTFTQALTQSVNQLSQSLEHNEPKNQTSDHLQVIDVSVLQETPRKPIRGRVTLNVTPGMSPFHHSINQSVHATPGRSRIDLEMRSSAPITAAPSPRHGGNGQSLDFSGMQPMNSLPAQLSNSQANIQSYSFDPTFEIKFVSCVDDWVLTAVQRLTKLRSNEWKLEKRLNKLIQSREQIHDYFDRITMFKQRSTPTKSPASQSDESSKNGLLSLFDRLTSGVRDSTRRANNPSDAAVTALAFDHRNRKNLHSLLSSVESGGLAMARSIQGKLMHSTVLTSELVQWFLECDVVHERVDAVELVDLLRRADLLQVVARQDENGQFITKAPNNRRFTPVVPGSFAALDVMNCVFLIGRSGWTAVDLSRSGWLEKVGRYRSYSRFFAWDTDLKRLAYFDGEKQAQPTRVYTVTRSVIIRSISSPSESQTVQAFARTGDPSLSPPFAPNPKLAYFEVAFKEPQHGEHSILLAASSPKDRDEWIRVMQLAQQTATPAKESKDEQSIAGSVTLPRSLSFESELSLDSVSRFESMATPDKMSNRSLNPARSPSQLDRDDSQPMSMLDKKREYLRLSEFGASRAKTHMIMQSALSSMTAKFELDWGLIDLLNDNDEEGEQPGEESDSNDIDEFDMEVYDDEDHTVNEDDEASPEGEADDPSADQVEGDDLSRARARVSPPVIDPVLAEARRIQRRVKVKRAMIKVRSVVESDMHPIGRLCATWASAFRQLYSRAILLEASSVNHSSRASSSSDPVPLLSNRHLSVVLSSAKEDLHSFVGQLTRLIATHLQSSDQSSISAMDTMYAEQQRSFNIILSPVNSHQSPHKTSQSLSASALKAQLVQEKARDIAAFLACSERVIIRRLFALIGPCLLNIYALKHAEADASLNKRLTDLRRLQFDAIGLSQQLVLPGMESEPKPNRTSLLDELLAMDTENEQEGQPALSPIRRSRSLTPRSSTTGRSSTRPYGAALDEFSRLTTLPDPWDKLTCILRVSRLICKCVDEARSSETVVINADDLLLLFTYLICTLHSNDQPHQAIDRRWHAQVAMMSDYLSDRDRCTLRGYYLATAQAAIELVETDEFTRANQPINQINPIDELDEFDLSIHSQSTDSVDGLCSSSNLSIDTDVDQGQLVVIMQ